MLPTAADELPKAVLLRLPFPASCLLLVSNGSEPEDDIGKPFDGTGEDPNVKEVDEDKDEDATNGLEELLLLDAIMEGVLVAPILLLATRDELLNTF